MKKTYIDENIASHLLELDFFLTEELSKEYDPDRERLLKSLQDIVAKELESIESPL